MVMKRRGRKVIVTLVFAVLAGGTALRAGQVQRWERAPGRARSLWQWVVEEIKAITSRAAGKACEHGSQIDPYGCPNAALTPQDPGEHGGATDPNG
jgi:hypothetical protein